MSRRRRNRELRENAVGISLAALALATLATFAYFYFQQKSAARALDEATLCPVDGPDSVTALLVDVTDEMTVAQRQDFLNQFHKTRNEIPRYGQMLVFAVAPTTNTLLSPVAALCNPGRGAEIDPLVGNPRKVEKRWQEEFEKPLDQAFSSMTAGEGALRSPILESIQSVALSVFQRPEAQGRTKRLIVASDLIQYTDGINFYKRLASPREFIDSAQFQSIKTDLRGVDVELWMLRRPDQAHIQTRDLVLLWEALLTEQGARLVRVYNVSG